MKLHADGGAAAEAVWPTTAGAALAAGARIPVLDNEISMNSAVTEAFLIVLPFLCRPTSAGL
jgi:hypothetical protein